MSRPKVDLRRILAIIDTNAMNVPQLGGLFARRPNAKETLHNVEPIDAPSPVAAARNDEKKARPAIPARPANPLFAPRSHDRREP